MLLDKHPRPGFRIEILHPKPQTPLSIVTVKMIVMVVVVIVIMMVIVKVVVIVIVNGEF